MNEEYLSHHGIKGQKWGVRRFQNSDGSLTDAGRKRYGSGDLSVVSTAKRTSGGLSDSQKQALKTAAKVALIAGSVAAAGYMASKNQALCQVALNQLGNIKVDTLDSISDASKIGKGYVSDLAKQAYEGAKAGMAETPKKIGEGIKEGISEGSKNLSKGLTQAPITVAKAAAEGAAIIATKKMMEATLGKDNVDSTTRAYNAYHKKNKIGQLSKKKDDDDDDD